MATMVRTILFTSSLITVGVLTTFAGCSSSSTKATGGTDSGVHDSSTHDVATGSSSGSASSSGGVEDSGEDASGGGCPNTGTPPTAPTYATPTKGQDKCQSSDISAFIAACIASTATSTGCNTWFTSNSGLASADGGGGTACGNCLFNETNPDLGGMWYGITEGGDISFGPNYGACIALVDTTNGTACATAYDSNQACNAYLCGDCASSGTAITCDQTVNATGAACSASATSTNTACATDFADGGVADTTCSPSTVNGDSTGIDDFEFMANLVCGNGSLTFTGDAGGGGG